MKFSITIKDLLEAYRRQKDNHTFLCTIINNMEFGQTGVINCTVQVKKFFDKYFVPIPSIDIHQHVSIPGWYFFYNHAGCHSSIQTTNGQTLDISRFNKSSDVRIFMMEHILEQDPNATFTFEELNEN